MVGSSGLSPLLLCADRGRVLSGINPASHRCALGKGRTLGTPRGSWPHFEGRWSWGQAVWGGNSEWCRRVLTSSVPGREPPVLCPGALVTRPRTGRACLPPWRLSCWKRRWCSPGHLNLSFPSSRKMATNFLVHEKIWFDKFKYDDAERKFYEQMNGPAAGSSRQENGASVILRDIARARENIQKSLAGVSTAAGDPRLALAPPPCRAVRRFALGAESGRGVRCCVPARTQTWAQATTGDPCSPLPCLSLARWCSLGLPPAPAAAGRTPAGRSFLLAPR